MKKIEPLRKSEDKNVSIILLNWNNWNETQECLESLEKVNYPNFEIIVVDNGSKNGDEARIQEFCLKAKIYRVLPKLYAKEDKIKAIFNKENLGFAGGNNVGIKYALENGADYVMLLNNDAIVAPDFLTELVNVGESDSRFGILGSRIYEYGTEAIAFDGGKVNKWLTKGEHKAVEIKLQQLREVDYITGAAMLIKREVIKKIGLMREEYFLYYEDVDWCLRARKAGYKCILVPASRIWHKISATNKEGSPSYIYYHTRNGLMLAKFNGNMFQKIAAYLIGAWILLKQILKILFVPQKHIWAKSMTKGVIDFYIEKYGKYAP